jgi:hypothetical protein
LIGAGLAFFALNRTPSRVVARRLRATGPAAALVLVALWVLAGDAQGNPRDWMYRGGFVACALLAGVVIASSVFAPGGILTRFLSLKPLVVLGAVSYGVYLWHWPIIVFIDPQQTHLSGLVLTGVRIALIAVFTALSYVLIEQPIRYRRWPVWVRAIVFPISIFLVVVLIIEGTSPSVVSPPASTSKHFDASGTLAGVGGLKGQQVIALSPGQPSAANPLRVGFFGDSMIFVAHAGLQAALESTGVITTQNFSFPGWGTSTIPLWREQLTKTIREHHTQIIIGTWRWDDDVALAHPKQYAATLREVVSVARAAGAEGVILLSYPKTGRPGGGTTKAALAHNARAEAAWQRAATQLPSQVPGHAMFMPIAPSVEFRGEFSTWLAPVGDPTAPAMRWERVRRLDGVHLCIPGIDRFATALTRDLTLAFKTPPAAKGWTAGDWTQDLVLTIDANKCPADHPARIPARVTR